MNRNKLSYQLLIVLIFITSFQFSAWGVNEPVYSILRNFISGAIFVLFFVSLRNPIRYYKNISTVRIHFIALVSLSLILTVLVPFSTKIEVYPIRDIFIALIILTIGLQVKLTEKQFIRLNTIYIILYVLAALSIVFIYSSGFIIQEQYLPVPKNQLAPAFGVGLLISLYFGFKAKALKKWLYYAFGLLMFSSLLVIRGRAAIVAVFIAMLIFILFYVRSRKYKVLIFSLIMIVLPFIGKYIYESLFLNYDLSDINSISTGRFQRNLFGLNYFIDNPFSGQLLNTEFNGLTIHNYILYNLVNYGLIFSSFLLLIYFKYIFIIIKAIKENTFQYFEIGPLVILILFIVSLFEYTYPYAPGSAIFFPFFLMGQYLRNKMNNSANFIA